jgi:hypothetical protein
MVDEIEKVKAALKWVLDSQAIWHGGYEHRGKTFPGYWSDGGCGCCSGTQEPPPEIAETLKEYV